MMVVLIPVADNGDVASPSDLFLAPPPQTKKTEKITKQKYTAYCVVSAVPLIIRSFGSIFVRTMTEVCLLLDAGPTLNVQLPPVHASHVLPFQEHKRRYKKTNKRALEMHPKASACCTT